MVGEEKTIYRTDKKADNNREWWTEEEEGD